MIWPLWQIGAAKFSAKPELLSRKGDESGASGRPRVIHVAGSELLSWQEVTVNVDHERTAAALSGLLKELIACGRLPYW